MQMGSLSQEVNRLSASVERQNTLIREIDVKTTTNIVGLQKDVEELRRDSLEIRQEVNRMGESQKFKWKSHDEERAAEKKDRDSKDRIQAVVNNQMVTVNKVIWAVFLIVSSLLIGFVWELIKNGGLRGMIVP